MFKQEKIARKLYEELTNNFSEGNTMVVTALEGEGVHWKCISKVDNVLISIYCCDVSDLMKKETYSEEFIASFYLDNKMICCGRSYNRKTVLESVTNWLQFKEQSELYKSFDFVDKGLRLVKELEAKWIENYPELKEATSTIDNHGSGIIRFEIKHGNRSCWFATTGEIKELSLAFAMDDCHLIETEFIVAEVAEVLNRYLVKKESISNLAVQFKWLYSNELVLAYENGNGVEGEFMESWNSILGFYAGFTEPQLPYKNKIIELIKQLVDKGFQRTIRAGQSMTTLILSRSRRHGLSNNHSFIAFEFRQDKMIVSTEKKAIYEISEIALDDNIIEIIRQLELKKIN